MAFGELRGWKGPLPGLEDDTLEHLPFHMGVIRFILVCGVEMRKRICRVRLGLRSEGGGKGLEGGWSVSQNT